MENSAAVQRGPGRPRREGPPPVAFQVRLDLDTARELRALARTNDRHAAAEIRRAVREHLARELGDAA